MTDAVLHGPPETGRGAPRGAPEEHRGRRCPECLGDVDTRLDYRKMFCSEPHRLAFHNRQLKRGRSLVVPAMADRITRGGERKRPRFAAGIAARQRSRRLIAQWIAEDRTAGRMMMDEYYELRDRLGFQD
jgi:hypothetical protein